VIILFSHKLHLLIGVYPPCEICGGQSGVGSGFSEHFFVFLSVMIYFFY
jgi:hypothetical protein